MKNIIISDIHSNVDSLVAFVKEIAEKEGTVDRLLIVGDIVGYGASPNECCDIVRYMRYGKRKVPLERIYEILEQINPGVSPNRNVIDAIQSMEKKCVVIGGNHDKQVVGEPSLTSEMNPVAQKAADWTREVLTKENFKFLKRLPLRKKFKKEGFEIVHSTPSYPRGYEYAKNASVLKYTTLWSKITFGGHTHRPAAYIYTKEKRMVNASVLIPTDNYDIRLMMIEKESADRVESFTVDQNNDWKYYVNVGSLGQPRDGNPDGCYVVFDSVSNQISFRRVKYNAEAASRKITEAKLPNELAQRVLKGV
ncbi:MAG: metallophosphoesterase [Candidatus Kuenenia sp.]|nr:metallophosphoesterase [Candidatus Kuenenia hertensis]